MALNDTAVRKAKPGEKPRKLSDARGLFLLLTPNGGKYWRFKYRFAGKEKLLALGTYPDVSLADAREKRDEARKCLAKEIDPGALKQLQKMTRLDAAANTYEMIAREWYVKHATNWAASHGEKILNRLKRDVFPWLGGRPISEITAPEILVVLRRIEKRGALDTAHRAHQNIGQVFRYAIASGVADRNPAADLRGALPPAKETHYPTITGPNEIGQLLRDIETFSGSFVTKCALRLAPLVFVRPGELRKAEWCEFDLDAAEWRIPAARMKMRELHIVPLSRQAIEVLRELAPLTDRVLTAKPEAPRYVFPGARSFIRPMSENTVNAALRRLGYAKEQITGHGFRSMASTILNEQGWNRDAIERQLAHGERDSIRAAYNYAEYLPERRRMMQAWADILGGFARGATIVNLNRSAS